MSQSMVSVVMPSLNQAAFVEAAIRSVLDQDFADVELLVIDGGSTDATLLRLEALLAEYGPRLRWVSERDSGPANAINKALRSVRGEIVGWLNSDDLYTPGAVSRAAACFEARPDVQMVYGEAEHVDATGRTLGRYPTRPPSVGIEGFHDGCFICQPSVFVRRTIFEKAGYLDEGLKTAFDFDMWLRCFKLLPGRIAHLEEVQAYSRLHAGSITLTQRRQVALEGIRLLAKYVGPPRAHWLMTYLDELCLSYPLAGSVTDINADLERFIEQVQPSFDTPTLDAIKASLAADARLRAALPGVFADIHPDGWAGRQLRVRMRRPPAIGGSSLRLHCLHDSPVGGGLSLAVHTSWGVEQSITVDVPGPFEIRVDIPEVRAGDGLVVIVEAAETFCPSSIQPGSMDARQLSFMVQAMQCGAAGESPPASPAGAGPSQERRSSWNTVKALLRRTDTKAQKQ